MQLEPEKSTAPKVHDQRTQCINEIISIPQSPDDNEDVSFHQSTRVPDGGFGWVVVTAGFMLSFLCDGVAMSFGLYMDDLIEYFKCSQAQMAITYAVFSGTYQIFCLPASALCQKFGHRPMGMLGSFIAGVSIAISIFSPNFEVLIIIFGFIGGIGYGLIYVAAIILVQLYFDSKRALVSGIVMSGSGFGGICFAYLTKFLLETYGWRGAWLITSGLVLNGIVFSACLRPVEMIVTKERNVTFNPPNAENKIVIGQTLNNVVDAPSIIPSSENDKIVSRNKKVTKYCLELFDLHLLISPKFMTFFASGLICNIGYFIPLTFIPLLTQSKGYLKEDESLLMAIVSASNIIARLSLGFIIDRHWISPFYLNGFLLMIGGIFTALFSHYNSMLLLGIASVFYGISIATYVMFRSPIIIELLGLERHSAAFGLMLVAEGLPSFFGGPIAGALSDISGNYNNSFYLAGGTLFIGGLLTLPLKWVAQWEDSRKQRKL